MFDFDELTERRGTGSLKWDTNGAADIVPLWVADMDFRTAPAVVEALQRRVAEGIFGYVSVPGSYYEALTGWFSRRHGWSIDPQRVIYTIGVVPAVSAIIKALVRPGEGVTVQTPAYNCFFSSVRNNKAAQVDNPLLRHDTATGFTYTMDLEGLERAAALPSSKLLILCNPHNPTGRVWTRSELEAVRDICSRHGVRVLSDEIHCELTHPGHDYVPYATVDPSAIVCCSPSKAFNTAGLQIANIVCPDAEVQALVDRAINDNEVCDVNPFGVVALQAAYNHGEEWLGELNAYLDANYRWLREFIARELPQWRVCDSESTYLAWVAVPGDADALCRRLLRDARVRLASGSSYGAGSEGSEGSEAKASSTLWGYVRINYACPRARLAAAMRQVALHA